MTSKPQQSPLLLVLLGALVGIAVGYGAAQFAARTAAPAPSDSTDIATAPLAGSTSPETNPEEYQERLMALGYSSGTEKAPEHSGVIVNHPDKTYPSYNVGASAHAPTAFLMDMNGNVLHKWAYSFHMLWPDVDPGEENVYYWRRVHLFENGDMLAIIEPYGIFKVDKDSNLIWENQCGAHHDLYVAPNGHIFVLTRRKIRIDLGDGERPVLEDFVTELDADGNEIRSVSILDGLRNTPYASLLKDVPDDWDILHTNALKPIQAGVDTKVPAFKPGSVLLSIRELGTIAVLDLESGNIEWAIKGQWFQQHESTLLDSGNLMLFDNKGNRGRSKVIEFDPVTQEIVWSYGTRDDQPLYSEYCGIAQRLPNGNTLINEALPGRVIEVSPDDEIVWEYINPNRVEGNEDTIATLMDFHRLPQAFEPDWLGSAAGPRAEAAK